MQNEKKKLGSKIKSLVSDYQNSDEEQDNISTEEDTEEEEEEEIENEGEINEEETQNKENDKNENTENDLTATTDKFNEQNLEKTEFKDVEELNEPFKSYKLGGIENGFLPGSEKIELPSPPKEPCSKELQNKIIQVRKKMAESNYNFNEEIQNKKAFKNPSIYEKFITHYDLDEFGSSFSTYVKDLKAEGYLFYDELDNIQRREWRDKEKEKEKKEKSKIEVVTGTRKPRITNV